MEEIPLALAAGLVAAFNPCGFALLPSYLTLLIATPGAGGMFCGNCFHDNTLVAALRRLGHDATMLPLYLPIRLDEEDESAGRPIFFGGINVYLEQKLAVFQRAPRWLRGLLNSPRLLNWAAGRAASTRAAEVGDIMLSMLRGELGNQNREITELIENIHRRRRRAARPRRHPDGQTRRSRLTSGKLMMLGRSSSSDSIASI